MKITIFTHSFPPIIGGAQTWQYYLATYLVKLGHEVQVITGDLPEGYQERDFSHDGFTLVRIKGLRKASKLEIPFKEIVPSVFKAIQTFAPDIIHSHGNALCLIISLMQTSLKAKHIFSYHATPIPEDQKMAGIFKEYPLEQSFTQYVLKYCPFDHYIANTNTTLTPH